MRRWEIILNKFNKEKGKKYDFRDIQITLQRNVPTDKGTETDRWLKLRGLLSDETVISNLPDDLDSQSEIDKMDLQNKNNIQKNIENMTKMGQNVNNSTLNVDQNNPNKQFEEKDEVKQENIKQSDTITKKDKQVEEK